MEDMCRAAIAAGVTELGFSDHFDLHPNEPFPDYLDPEAWWSSYRNCELKFGDDLVLRAGIEIGEPHRFTDRVRQLLDQYPWDFVLGSLHWVGDICVFDQPYFGENPDTPYARYFDELARMVEIGDFDILGHFDVVKRYGFEHYGDFQPERHEPMIRHILRLLAERDLAIEINTSTLRRSIQQPSPSFRILEWFREEGGQFVTLGSDAHTTQDVGFGLRAMKNMVATAGFKGLARYKNRKISSVDFSINL
jgi:histidinol-phosphatase (PHP family)